MKENNINKINEDSKTIKDEWINNDNIKNDLSI